MGRDRWQREIFGLNSSRGEDAVIREEQRKSAWMDVPEWRTFWDEATKDFKVPDGWPSGCSPSDRPAPKEIDDGNLNTFMHELLRRSR
jgi:hypothetical protein